MTSDADVPTLIFSGEYSEALFLKSLLEAVAIDAQLVTGRSGPPRIFVRSSEADDARAVVADFERNGKRSAT